MLAVEAAVGAAILVLTVGILPESAKRPWGRMFVVLTASLLAYAGLAV